MIKEAKGPILWYLRACKFDGWTSFWKDIYLVPEHITNERLIRHESKHLEQIERDGRIKFSIKYAYWTMRHGYWNNPYEIEARAAE
jgi:hypothetical protein